MKIVIANGPGRLDNGADVILFPSRWDSAVPNAPFRFYPYELAYLSTLLKRELPGATVTMLDGNIRGWDAVVNYPDYPADRIMAVRMGCGL